MEAKAHTCCIIISSRAHEFGLNTERLANTKIKLAIAAFRIEQAGSGPQLGFRAQ